MDNYRLEFDEATTGSEYWLSAAAASVPGTYILAQFYVIHSPAIFAHLGLSKLLLTMNQVFAPQLMMLLGVLGMAVLFGELIDFQRICFFKNWRKWFIPLAMGLEILLFVPFLCMSWFSMQVVLALRTFAPESTRVMLEMSKALQELLMKSDWSVFLIIAFAAVIVAPVIEEIVFRAVLFNFFSRRVGVVAGVIITSLIFSVFHLNAISFVVLFLLGVVLQLLYIKTGSIFASMLFHFTHNAVAITILLVMKIIHVQLAH